MTITLHKSTSVANINLSPGYNKIQVYYQQAELGQETYLDPLVADPEAVKISDNEDKTNRQADPEGSLQEYEAPTQFNLNGVK